MLSYKKQNKRRKTRKICNNASDMCNHCNISNIYLKLYGVKKNYKKHHFTSKVACTCAHI